MYKKEGVTKFTEQARLNCQPPPRSNPCYAAKCNTNAKCNNFDAKCNKVFNAKCNNFFNTKCNSAKCNNSRMACMVF